MSLMIIIKKNIIVTTPKSEIANSAYEAQECIKSGGGFYVRKLGKNRPKNLHAGSKVYYVEDGYIRGFGEVGSVVQKEFSCESTGKNWGLGWFAIITACSWKWIKPISMVGFQGYHYFDDKDVEVIGNWLDSKPKTE